MAISLDQPAPDLAAIKQRQQATWGTGDYHRVAARIAFAAERLCDTADLRAGARVLDVATGSGNAAIAAARNGCTVVGVDYVPSLLDRARVRAAAEDLDVSFMEGDAEQLPFPDASFDAVTSVFGCMFAPDQVRTASELMRVCRPGGTIALANWTPEGFIGEMFRTVGGHMPPPAPGVASPALWGTELRLRALFGSGVSELRTRERTFTFRYTSPEDFVEFFRRWYGPMVSAFSALQGQAGEALERDLLALVARFDRGGNGWAAIPATYLEVVAVRA